MNPITFADTHQEEMLSLLKTLAQIPAPSHQEHQRVAFLKQWLEDIGAEGVYVDEALNVILPLGDTGENDLVMFTAHTDVVFPDVTPLPLREEAGWLHCPGVGDDTANVVQILLTAKYILQEGLRPKDKGVILVLNSCEEGLGDLKGCKALMAKYGDRLKEFVSLDGSFRGITNGAVGSKRYQVEINTEGGHSFNAFGNRNAIYYMSCLIGDLYAIKAPNRGKTTYNVGTIQGGTSVNTIAQSCQMLYEFRSSSKEDLAEMEAHFLAAIAFYRTKGIEVNVTLVGDRPCSSAVDPEAHQALFDRAAAAIEKHYGTIPAASIGSTDCNIPLSMGIPSIATGGYFGKGIHTREESLEIASLYPGLKMAMELILHHF